MADIKLSIGKTLINEGGYVNNAADPGGATKYGVTQHDITGLEGFPVDVKDLTPEQATDYYLNHYWDKFGEEGKYAKAYYPGIVTQSVLDKVYDTSVLFGIGEVVKLVETVLYLTVDGFFGANDLHALNEAEPDSFIQALKTAEVAHAIGIVNAHTPSKIFLAGWIRRINS